MKKYSLDMAKIYYFVNRTKKQIITTTPYDITRSLFKNIKDREWSTFDTIDLLTNDDIDVKELIHDFWYTLDPKLKE